LGEERPSLVISPTSAYFQKTPRDAFELEAQALDQPDRADTRRLNACLEAVQLELRERARDHARQRLAQQPPPAARLARGVAERRRIARIAHDLVQVDDPDELVGRGVHDEKRDLIGLPLPAQIAGELLARRRRLDEHAVQAPAAANGG